MGPLVRSSNANAEGIGDSIDRWAIDAKRKSSSTLPDQNGKAFSRRTDDDDDDYPDDDDSGDDGVVGNSAVFGISRLCVCDWELGRVPFDVLNVGFRLPNNCEDRRL